ncbi:hypothetical protein G6L37_05475 [Agrobacterium rubi]|nr:hypothetical protein [Agrobacterium rubi]NTF24808.1 hypothetical protein [Agrobacterium rubi]
MTNKKTFLDGRIIVEVERIPDHDLGNLFAHLDHVRQILDSIPSQYRAAATIGIWGEDALVVEYERPATTEEIEEDRLERSRHVTNGIDLLDRRIETLISDARAAGVDLADMRISEQPDHYVIRKKPRPA